MNSNWRSAICKSGAQRAGQRVPMSEVIWVIVLTKDNLWDFIKKESILDRPAEVFGELEMLQLLQQFFMGNLLCLGRLRTGGREPSSQGDGRILQERIKYYKETAAIAVIGDRIHEKSGLQREVSGSAEFGWMDTMPHKNRDILEILRLELKFLEEGGYADTPFAPWRAPYIFEDSPSCLNFGDAARPHPCLDCLLTQLVPPEFRKKDVPCRFIPLNDKGRPSNPSTAPAHKKRSKRPCAIGSAGRSAGSKPNEPFQSANSPHPLERTRLSPTAEQKSRWSGISHPPKT